MDRGNGKISWELGSYYYMRFQDSDSLISSCSDFEFVNINSIAAFLGFLGNYGHIILKSQASDSQMSSSSDISFDLGIQIAFRNVQWESYILSRESTYVLNSYTSTLKMFYVY